MKSYVVFAVLVTLFGSFFNSGCSKSELSGDNSRQEKTTFAIVPDKINPIDREFPGGRGADELVLYTPEFGIKTGTNKYGIEAIVENGVIRSIGSNDSEIPKTGFVLSGHGKMSRWISKHLYPGIEVTVEKNKIIFQITDETRLYYADCLVRDAQSNLENIARNDSLIDISQINDFHENSKKYNELARQELRNGNRQQYRAYAQKALDDAFARYFQSFPGRQKELRACWYRLTEKSPVALEQTIAKIAEIGFNAICPETIYGGYAIYPSAHIDLQQNPDFRGWDPLKVLVASCKKHNVKLIPWVWVYFVGFKDSPLIKIKHEWLGLSHHQEHPSRLEPGYHFFCPSQPAVLEFWLAVYTNLLKNYDIDGLQLDYIRYPVSIPYQDGFCYCDCCRKNFKKVHGVDPLGIDPEADPDMWGKWNSYRVNQVNEFVRMVHELVKKIKPEIKLSADVFPVLEESIASKFQDWDYWLEQNYLDEIFTMSYTADADQVFREGKDLVTRLSPGINGYVGLGPYLGLRPEILVQQIYQAQKSGADGVALFSLGSLSDAQIEALKQGPFRTRATW